MVTRRTWLLFGTAALATAVAASGFFLWGGPDVLNAQTCREPAPLRFEIASKIERSELGWKAGTPFAEIVRLMAEADDRRVREGRVLF